MGEFSDVFKLCITVFPRRFVQLLFFKITFRFLLHAGRGGFSQLTFFGAIHLIHTHFGWPF